MFVGISFVLKNGGNIIKEDLLNHSYTVSWVLRVADTKYYYKTIGQFFKCICKFLQQTLVGFRLISVKQKMLTI